MSFNVSASTVGMWIVNKQAPNPAGITDSPNAVRYVLSHDGCATQLPLVARFQSWQSALLREVSTKSSHSTTNSRSI